MGVLRFVREDDDEVEEEDEDDEYEDEEEDDDDEYESLLDSLLSVSSTTRVFWCLC